MKNLRVPLLKQKKMACGPTSLRMVLKYFGKHVPLKDIIKGVSGIKKFGVRTIELGDFAKKQGFKVTCYSYNKDGKNGWAKVRRPYKSDILKFLRKGLPVIIAVSSHILYNEKPSKLGHFIVITKYNNHRFRYNDPFDGKRHNINEEDLIFAWYVNAFDSKGHILVIEPKSKVK